MSFNSNGSSFPCKNAEDGEVAGQNSLSFCTTYRSVKEKNSSNCLIVCRCPFYYHVKFAFLVWLQLPSADVSLRICFFEYMASPGKKDAIFCSKQ